MMTIAESVDEEFGSLRPPSSVTRQEATYAPASIFKIDETAAEWLLSFHNLSGLRPFRHALRSFVFIWVVNEQGELWIAVEEIAPEDGSEADFDSDPRRGFPFRADLLPGGPKLGHPSLLTGAQARAAGELALQLNPAGDSLVWVLNGNSGRYSRFAPPSPEQLENVAKLLRKHQIEVEIEP